MSAWWEEIGGRPRRSPPPASHPVGEDRDPLVFADPDDDEGTWTRVGELDTRTGRWVTPPAPGWERRIGWRPLREFLRDR
jgi:hypothetical protein